MHTDTTRTESDTLYVVAPLTHRKRRRQTRTGFERDRVSPRRRWRRPTIHDVPSRSPGPWVRSGRRVAPDRSLPVSAAVWVRSHNTHGRDALSLGSGERSTAVRTLWEFAEVNVGRAPAPRRGGETRPRRHPLTERTRNGGTRTEGRTSGSRHRTDRSSNHRTSMWLMLKSPSSITTRNSRLPAVSGTSSTVTVVQLCQLPVGSMTMGPVTSTPSTSTCITEPSP